MTAKHGKHNVERARRFQTKSIKALQEIAASGSLASAAAEYALQERSGEKVERK